MPWSHTAISTCVSLTEARTSIGLPAPNFIALLIRLVSTCSTRTRSHFTMTSGGTETVTGQLARRKSGAIVVITSSTSSSRFVSSTRNQSRLLARRLTSSSPSTSVDSRRA